MANPNIEEQVTAAIKSRIAEVIDPAIIQALADAEIERLIKPGTRYGAPEPSPLAQYVHREVSERIAVKVKDVISSPETEELICKMVADHLAGESGAPAIRACVAGMTEAFLRNAMR
jgi:hypothetical protein